MAVVLLYLHHQNFYHRNNNCTLSALQKTVAVVVAHRVDDLVHHGHWAADEASGGGQGALRARRGLVNEVPRAVKGLGGGALE